MLRFFYMLALWASIFWLVVTIAHALPADPGQGAPNTTTRHKSERPPRKPWMPRTPTLLWKVDDTCPPMPPDWNPGQEANWCALARKRADEPHVPPPVTTDEPPPEPEIAQEPPEGFSRVPPGARHVHRGRPMYDYGGPPPPDWPVFEFRWPPYAYGYGYVDPYTPPPADAPGPFVYTPRFGFYFGR